MFGDLYDLTVRMSIFVGRIASAVTYTMPKRMVCEARAKRALANHERRRADADVSEVSHHHKSIVSTNTVLTNTDRRNTTDPGRVRPQRPDLARAPKSVYKDTIGAMIKAT